MQLHVASLFRGTTVEIVDWRCAGRVEPFGGEEWSDVHEVVVPRRGAYLRRMAGRDRLIDPGTVAFSHPGESYRVRHPVPGGDACSAFRLSAGAAAQLAASLSASTDVTAVPFPADAAPLDGAAYLLHRMAVRAASDPRAGALEVEERAVRFLRAALAAALARCGAAPLRSPARRNRRAAEYAARVREVVARAYREPLTLAGIAGAVGCSPFHLSRLVTAVEGVSIHRLVVRLRLREALERLLETRDGVSAIAYATGFSSHSPLTDAFRREYGCPPVAVRRLSRRELRRCRSGARFR